MIFSRHKFAFALFLFVGLCGTTALSAQQSSSSTAQVATPAPVAATPLSKWFVEGAAGVDFGPGLANGQCMGHQLQRARRRRLSPYPAH